MCFSPKIKMPKVDTPQMAAAPAPLADTVQGVEFGGMREEDKETPTGRKGLTNKRVSKAFSSRMGGKK